MTLATYEGICASLREKLAEAEKYQEMVETRVLKRRCLQSARRRVPLEVWHLIFQFTFFRGNIVSHVLHPISSSSTSFMPIFISPHIGHNLPLKYSHVCFSWRNIIFDHGRFWSKIKLDAVVFTTPSALRLVSDILGRSEPYSLQIEVTNARDYHLTAFTPEAINVLTVAASRAHSWCSDIDIFSKIDFAGRLVWPELKDVQLHGIVPTNHSRSSSQVQNVICAPRLQGLNIDLSIHTLLLLGHSIQPNLRVLCLRDPTPIHLLSLLIQSCPNLRCLRVHAGEMHRPATPIQPANSVTVPNLRELALESHWGPTTAYLRDLTTPALEKLYLPPETWPFDTSNIFYAFLERSQCPLRTLKISIPNSYHPPPFPSQVGVRSISDIFGLLSGLQELHVQFRYPSWDNNDNSTNNHNSITPVFTLPYVDLPSLVALRIWVGGSFSEQAVADTIEIFLVFLEGMIAVPNHTIKLAELLLEVEFRWADDLVTDSAYIEPLPPLTAMRLQAICNAGIACSILRYPNRSF
ncbi:hypothetical protein PQX77_016046 [Marasmius sp. AFHP31]|nr:hypothetical protein PQX77_016046 [Marasmius sp. AFHP31]